MKMKLWLIHVLWLIAFFFLSIFKPSISQPLYSRSLVKRSSDLSSSALPSSRRETVLVATLDGTLSLVEINSLKILWSIKTGLPIYSSYQASHNIDLNLENVSGLRDDTYIDCGDDWILYRHDRSKGIIERLKSAKDLIRETKGLSKNGTSVISQMATTVFVVDAKTGTIIRTVKFSDSSGLGFEDGENPVIIRDEGKSQISITRTDYSFLAYSKSSGKVLWNVSLAEFEAESFCPKVDRSIVDSLQDQLSSVYNGRSEACEPCLRRNIVYRIRDRGFSELVSPDSGAGLVNDLQRSLPGDRKLQLPGPGHLHFPVPISEPPDAHHDLNQVLALPAPESAHSFAHSEVLALPPSAHRSGYTIYPESSSKHFFWSPIFSGLILITAVIAVFRSVFGREHSQREDLKSKSTPSKKKKPRKSGINNTNINSAKGRNFDADDSSLAGFSPIEVLKESSFASSVDVHVGGWKIGKLYISQYEIAKGSNGTAVFEGTYDGRAVAVKRLVRTHHDVALKEIQNLMASDQHPNIVRFYGVESDTDFVYLSLERCLCSLNDLISVCSESSQASTSTETRVSSSMSAYTAQSLEKIEAFNDTYLWKSNGYPSTQLLKVMRDVVSGVAHLHEISLIHRDLKPQNVLIIKDKNFRAKLSDMGISKRLPEDMSSVTQNGTGSGSSGWRAPEQLRESRHTRAVDLFSLGCVLFFCLTKGKHPFGENFERDANIVKNEKDLFLIEDVPEALDLITNLLDPNPELRPKADVVLHHPLFWDSEKRLSFLRDASDRVELEDREIDSDLLKALESTATVALGGKWDDKLESSFLTNITRYRRYKYYSVRDLLRVIRNKLNHYRELHIEIQEVLGSVPEGFDNYFRDRFPKLLIEVYKVIYEYCHEEELLGKYFRNSLL
ncbi:serine/threonine-protein kinase/endoribonuclease IRE1b-like [Chenopodium quinoa]|uniref:serine/threonine-protein kinase/endoribonuclease IRE1b-like n=1 Tax=Chenopodium quinoa TaxID=63459 RepID=UPI000B7931AE|nr:serine/threonine-protein kinase/endoribonuclease IRE1b-like [Chenopodium quinoa]